MLCLIKHLAVVTYVERTCSSIGTGWRRVVGSYPGRLASWEGASATRWLRGSVVPIAVLDFAEKRNVSCPWAEYTLHSSTVQATKILDYELKTIRAQQLRAASHFTSTFMMQILSRCLVWTWNCLRAWGEWILKWLEKRETPKKVLYPYVWSTKIWNAHLCRKLILYLKGSVTAGNIKFNLSWRVIVKGTKKVQVCAA